MLRMLFLPVVMTSLVGSVPAAAQDAAQAQTPGKKASAVDPERQICRSRAKVGSLIPVRECHTAAEWAYLRGATSGVSEQAIDKLRSTRVLKDAL